VTITGTNPTGPTVATSVVVVNAAMITADGPAC
jgi:hypothetical protein